jgi:hypothetical protein
MENFEQDTNMNQNNQNGNNGKGASWDTQVMEVVDEMMQKIRDLLDQFEAIIHEVWNVASLVAAMIKEFRRMFSFNERPSASRADAQPA